MNAIKVSFKLGKLENISIEVSILEGAFSMWQSVYKMN